MQPGAVDGEVEDHRAALHRECEERARVGRNDLPRRYLEARARAVTRSCGGTKQGGLQGLPFCFSAAEVGANHQRTASCKARRSWARQSGSRNPNVENSLALESSEFSGLRAGTLYCSLVMGTTRLAIRGDPNSPVPAGQEANDS